MTAFAALYASWPYARDTDQCLDAFGVPRDMAAFRVAVEKLNKYLTSKMAVRRAVWIAKTVTVLPQPYSPRIARALSALYFVTECYRRRVSLRHRNEWVGYAFGLVKWEIDSTAATAVRVRLAPLLDEAFRMDLDWMVIHIDDKAARPAQSAIQACGDYLNTMYRDCTAGGLPWHYPDMHWVDEQFVGVHWTEHRLGRSLNVHWDGEAFQCWAWADGAYEFEPMPGEGETLPGEGAGLMRWLLREKNTA